MMYGVVDEWVCCTVCGDPAVVVGGAEHERYPIKGAGTFRGRVMSLQF